jgi:shikimate dehydrogenase
VVLGPRGGLPGHRVAVERAEPAAGPGGAAARAAGVMGRPIAHSLSPALHRAAYDGLGLTAWTYTAVEVGAEELPAALDRLGPEWVGVSLTMPLKQVVFPLLDSISDLARAVGAVNTVTLGPQGRYGDNTDVYGIVAALRAAGVRSAGGAVVLGGGATAASALAALRELGEAEPMVVVRSLDRAGGLRAAAERLGVRPGLRPWDEAAARLRAAPLVLSTVPAGAADALAADLPATIGTLLDVVYRPWPTPLGAAWAAAGGRAVSGLEMLLHQAVAQVEAWTGRSPDLPAMRRAGQASAELAEAPAEPAQTPAEPAQD